MGVTCTSADDCWAVGGYSYKDVALRDVGATLIQRWDGTAWSIVPSPNYSNGGGNPAIPENGNGLAAVTCASASDCWAVGGYAPFRERGRTLIARWDGTSWSLLPSPNTAAPEDSTGFAAVTCSSVSDCWAVGNYARMMGSSSARLSRGGTGPRGRLFRRPARA